MVFAGSRFENGKENNCALHTHIHGWFLLFKCTWFKFNLKTSFKLVRVIINASIYQNLTFTISPSEKENSIYSNRFVDVWSEL